MSKTARKTTRVVSVVAATAIALACGTNYGYSAWAPQFATRLKLSATESNIIGTLGNLGMYLSGIPLGLLVDTKGPRVGLALGGLLLVVGYYPIKLAYDRGEGSFSVPVLSFFSYLTGAGSCVAFSAALKTCALNYPDHRGTATAFPLAGFGLSAAFFSAISTFAFPDDTSKFLLLLSVGTFLLIFVSFFSLRPLPPSRYQSLPLIEPRESSSSQTLHRRKPSDGALDHAEEQGAQSISQTSASASESDAKDHVDGEETAENPNETSSLLSKSSSGPGDVPFNRESNESDPHGVHRTDIRGLGLIPRPEFWNLFLIFGLLTGIGLMTINNIGNDAQALWRHYDDSAPPSFISRRQLHHVTIISLSSFTGRLASGIGSDLIVKRLHASRFWCLFVSAATFCLAQIAAISIWNPHLLYLVSALTGLAYGLLFGVYPSLVAYTFGVAGLSQNWGAMTLAPVVSGNVFNLLYGAIYDRHSVVGPNGHRECPDGLACYRTAYVVTLFSGVAGVLVVLWSIWHERGRERRRKEEEEEEAEAEGMMTHERDA